MWQRGGTHLTEYPLNFMWQREGAFDGISFEFHVAAWGGYIFRSGLDEFSYNFGKMAGCR